MKLIDLKYYINILHKDIECKIYLNHENWLEILKEIGYGGYEKCDYFHISNKVRVYSTINTFNYSYNYIMIIPMVNQVMTSYTVLSENERLIKDIIE